MSDIPDFAPPHTLRSRESQLRPGSANARESSGNMTVAYGTDDGMIVEFFEEPLYMEYLSKQVGHPIFRLQIMTRILQPGNRNTVWVHATKGISYEMAIDSESGEYHTDWDVMEVCENGDPPEPLRYPNAWARFMRKGVMADTGLPIEQWSVITRSYAESLKASNVHTVEALAALTDSAAQNIMGAVKYRDLARAHLDERKRSEIVSREQERASRFEEDSKQKAKHIEGLQASVLALQAQLAEVRGIAPPTSGDRQPHVSAAIAPQLKQMSATNARKKHKIPGPDKAA